MFGFLFIASLQCVVWIDWRLRCPSFRVLDRQPQRTMKLSGECTPHFVLPVDVLSQKHSWLLERSLGAGVSKVAFKEGAFRSYQECCTDMADRGPLLLMVFVGRQKEATHAEGSPDLGHHVSPKMSLPVGCHISSDGFFCLFYGELI